MALFIVDAVPDVWAKVSEKYQWEPKQENLTKSEILKATSAFAVRMLLDKKLEREERIFF